MDITHDNVCSSMLSCFYSHLLSTGRPISSFFLKYMNIFIYFTNIRGFRFNFLYFKHLQMLIVCVIMFL